MRVGLISPYDLGRHGGVQNQILELARLLTENGDEPIVIGPGAVEGVDLGESFSLRANQSTVPLKLDPRVGGVMEAAVAEVDVVHLHEPLIPMIGWAGIRLRRPAVVTFHADKPRWAHLFYKAVPDRVWGRKVLTAVSPVAAELPWTGVRVIPNGLNLSFFRSGAQRHRQRAVFVGRDDRRKGFAVLREAWTEVHATVPAAELIAIGPEGHDGQGIRFAGRTTDEMKSTWLQSASILVAPNLGGESFGMVVAEGMAAGCAIVASDLPAFQYVTAGTARLTPPGQPRPLAAALIDLLTQPGQTTSMAKRSRDRARAFDWAEVFGQYRSAYADALRIFGNGR